MNIEKVIDGLVKEGANPSPAATGMIRFQNSLAALKHELDRMSDWTDAEVKDEQLGKDMDALRQHLDNATGRTSTVIDRLRRIK